MLRAIAAVRRYTMPRRRLLRARAARRKRKGIRNVLRYACRALKCARAAA